MIATENFVQVEVHSQEDLRDWLAGHFDQEESIWLVTYKKSKPDKYVGTGQVLDELLCYGWIDGVRRKLDEHRTMQLISPRRVQHWAKSYKDRAARLIAEGKMHPAGLRSIALSKENGLWDFMNDVDQLIIPDDLAEALQAKPAAQAFFQAINNSSKRNALRWLKLAKTDKTRRSRITKLVAHSAQGEKLPGS
ncbi:MAG: YdeI/OmpD-associated family protein [Bacteroidota bacterium]